MTAMQSKPYCWPHKVIRRFEQGDASLRVAGLIYLPLGGYFGLIGLFAATDMVGKPSIAIAARAGFFLFMSGYVISFAQLSRGKTNVRWPAIYLVCGFAFALSLLTTALVLPMLGEAPPRWLTIVDGASPMTNAAIDLVAGGWAMYQWMHICWDVHLGRWPVMIAFAFYVLLWSWQGYHGTALDTVVFLTLIVLTIAIFVRTMRR